ncbi:wax ester/triacylglycerol synthase family O-acyltransferase [Sulfuritalea hydrogenivorans]|uniref:diacylglycerol O-acyltransferase n=1 Tax=Sulfuritalea hydrogenivorans sk43H TaxID=1223802 RepID=W0SCP2_9PROT|nr:wax ester/triacylglycerol synthase family O-acyltransferase [Sulfuritalea hydrogenivorans]BAO28979.1 acyltransferase [Sulfuritalea hydrogenivorans sk43H]
MSRKNPKESGIETLSGVDGAFLNLETAATPMHVGSLHLFEVPAGYQGDFYKAVRHMMESRMVPVLRRRLASLPLHLANPVWLQGEVDLDRHIRRVRLPKPGTWAQLEAVVADLHAELLDRSHPLWMLYVLEGLASGEKAYYFKIHHAMLDGQAGVALAGALFDTTPDAAPVPKRRSGQAAAAKAATKPGTLALAAAAFRHDAAQYVKLVRELPGVVRTLAGIVRSSSGRARGKAGSEHAADFGELKRSVSFGPRTAFNVTITPERGFATATVSRAELKAIAAANEATVNDVVLALCSGTLRRYLKRNATIPRKPLIASMPISLREQGNTEMRTQATLSLVNLASNVADPQKRLRAIRDSAGATKAVARQAKSVIPTDFPLIGVPWLVGALASLYGRRGVVETLPVLANVLVSNVPGPPVPLYVNGLRMTGYWPLSIVEHGVGLNITLMSYAGNLCLGFVVARNAVPDARELADDFLDAFEELKQRMQKPARAPRKIATVEPAEKRAQARTQAQAQAGKSRPAVRKPVAGA